MALSVNGVECVLSACLCESWLFVRCRRFAVFLYMFVCISVSVLLRIGYNALIIIASMCVTDWAWSELNWVGWFFCEVGMGSLMQQLGSGMWMGVVWALIAYLFGSVSFAIVLSKVFRMQDPRSYGSNNPGATNMLRSGRKEVALLTLLGDVLKGFLPVYLAASVGELSVTALGCVALAAFLGHLYPIYFGFVGGKGVATFLGAVLGLSAMVGLWVILVWLAVALVFRFSSLASLVASVFALVLFAFEYGLGLVLLPLAAMVLLMFYRHRENIQKLLMGQERRLFAPKE